MLVIFNPTAGRRRRSRLDRVLAELAAAGAAVELRPTAHAGDAEAIAAAAAPPADGLIVAAGGDGTLAEVVNGLIANPARDAFRLGLIPLGTANVLAHEIGLPEDAAGIARVLLAGAPRTVHPGRIRRDGAPDRHFLMMAGAGFDAAVVAAVTPRLKRLLGKGAYVWQTLRRAAAGRSPELAVSADGAEFAAQSVVACNGRRYGGPYVLAPAADLSEPWLQVVLLARAGGWRVFPQGLRLMLGRLAAAPEVRLTSARRIAVSGVGCLQADGDAAGPLPVTIEATDVPLSLMTPRRDS
ncbi:MAG: diacylglycerol kinase family protein [Rhodospirillaceae bacterium]